MKCWICEAAEANSGEHLILHAVLREAFKGITQQKPAFYHSSKHSNFPVAGFSKHRFKFPKVICEFCNNTVTQNYDSAFLLFFRHMQNQKRSILKKGRINLNRIYNGERFGLIELYLYFLKVYGCTLVADGKVLRDPRQWMLLRQSILQKKILFDGAHIGIHIDHTLPHKQSVSFMPFIERRYQGLMIELVWFVVMITVPFRPHGKKWGRAWNPSTSRKAVIKIGSIQ